MAYGFNEDRSKYDLDSILEDIAKSAVQLDAGTIIADSTDLDTITTTGNYAWAYSGDASLMPTNGPNDLSTTVGFTMQVGELPDVRYSDSRTDSYKYQFLRDSQTGAMWYRWIQYLNGVAGFGTWNRLTPSSQTGSFYHMDYGQASADVSVMTFGNIGMLSAAIQTSASAPARQSIRVGGLTNTGMAPSKEARCTTGSEAGNLGVAVLRTDGYLNIIQQTAGSHWYNVNMVYPYNHVNAIYPSN